MPEPLNAPDFDKKSWGIDVGAGGATEGEDPFPDLYSRCISQTDSWYLKMVSLLLSSQADTESNSESYHQTSHQTYNPKEQRFSLMTARLFGLSVGYFQGRLVPELFLR